MPFQFTSPVGRIVGGDPYKSYTPTDDRTKKPKTHPDGSPWIEQYVKIAYPKTDAETVAWKAGCDAEAKAAWPQFFQTGACSNPKFSTKIVDGDGTNTKGVSYASREGYAGCWVVTYSRIVSMIGGVPVDKHNGAAWVETQPGAVKVGDYVKVLGETKSNQSTQTEGMYMNMNRLAFWQEGKAIIVGPDADAAWGAAPPPGTVPTGAPLGAPGATTPPPGAGLTTGAPAGTYGGYMDAGAIAAAPPPPGAAAAPPPPSAVPAPVMTAKASGMTREAYNAAGWTDDQLIQHGYMVA